MRAAEHTGEPGCKCPRFACRDARRKRREAHRADLAALPLGLREREPVAREERPRSSIVAAKEETARPVATVHSTTARPHKRRVRIESGVYLAWVRNLPCALADRPGHPRTACVSEIAALAVEPMIVDPALMRPRVDPHHVRTRGAGGPDIVTIPLCRIAHDLVGAGRIDRLEVDAALGRTLLLAARQPREWWTRVLADVQSTDERTEP